MRFLKHPDFLNLSRSYIEEALFTNFWVLRMTSMFLRKMDFRDYANKFRKKPDSEEIPDKIFFLVLRACFEKAHDLSRSFAHFMKKFLHIPHTWKVPNVLPMMDAGSLQSSTANLLYHHQKAVSRTPYILTYLGYIFLEFSRFKKNMQ